MDNTAQEMRVILALLEPATLLDVRQLAEHAIYRPDDYSESQQFGHALRITKSFGIHYQSVRADGECLDIFRPKVLSVAIHWRYLRYQNRQNHPFTGTFH